jgi:RimJ/RimL family protein N-acetyltransferase
MTTDIREGEPYILRDGSWVAIRPVRPEDAALLTDGFARLSARSRQTRFFTGKLRLSEAEVRFLTNIDHHNHEALGAVSRDGSGVGVARYIRDPDERGSAEVAVTVVDEWQGRGLGSKLLALLSGRARAAGITRFTAVTAADNTAAKTLIVHAGGTLVSRRGPHWEYEISLEPLRDEGLTAWLRDFEIRFDRAAGNTDSVGRSR